MYNRGFIYVFQVALFFWDRPNKAFFLIDGLQMRKAEQSRPRASQKNRSTNKLNDKL